MVTWVWCGSYCYVSLGARFGGSCEGGGGMGTVMVAGGTVEIICLRLAWWRGGRRG